MTALPIFDPDWSTVSAMLSPSALPRASALSLVPLETHRDRPRVFGHPVHDRLVRLHPGAVHRPGGLVHEQVVGVNRKAHLAVVGAADEMELIEFNQDFLGRNQDGSRQTDAEALCF